MKLYTFVLRSTSSLKESELFVMMPDRVLFPFGDYAVAAHGKIWFLVRVVRFRLEELFAQFVQSVKIEVASSL